MKADSYFEIGATHQVCQDYAIAHASDDFAYAIVSDGCTSSPDTDIGARLLSIIAEDAISYLHQRECANANQTVEEFVNLYSFTLKELVIKKCLEVKGSLNLPIEAFDATLLIAIVYKKFAPLLVGWGDGNFIIKYNNDAVHTVSISFDNNMPYYLSYQMSHARDLLYKDQQTGVKHIAERVFNRSKSNPMSSSWTDLENDHSIDHNLSMYLNDSGIGDPRDITQLVVSSDGLQSFQFDPRSDEFLKNDKVFPLSAVYLGVTTYKNPVGEFVVRRMKSLDKENRSKHIIHYDDVSCAAIILD